MAKVDKNWQIPNAPTGNKGIEAPVDISQIGSAVPMSSAGGSDAFPDARLETRDK